MKSNLLATFPILALCLIFCVSSLTGSPGPSPRSPSSTAKANQFGGAWGFNLGETLKESQYQSIKGHEGFYVVLMNGMGDLDHPRACYLETTKNKQIYAIAVTSGLLTSKREYEASKEQVIYHYLQIFGEPSRSAYGNGTIETYAYRRDQRTITIDTFNFDDYLFGIKIEYRDENLAAEAEEEKQEIHK